jgi:hypothetical protein
MAALKRLANETVPFVDLTLATNSLGAVADPEKVDVTVKLSVVVIALVAKNNLTASPVSDVVAFSQDDEVPVSENVTVIPGQLSDPANAINKSPAATEMLVVVAVVAVLGEATGDAKPKIVDEIVN